MKKFYCLYFFMVLTGVVVKAQTFSLLKDINTGSGGSSPSSLINVNGTLFFSANDGINGQELWKTDGTSIGTVMIKDINPGAGSSSPAVLANMNGVVYFRANDGTHGNELWKTDGTVAGTVMVKDINTGINSSTFNGGIVINNILFLDVNDGSHGFELWKTDGTEEGTMLLKDINTSSSGGFPGNNSYPFSLTAMNGILYFGAMDMSANPLDGSALWRSDGTPAGTQLVKYIGINQIRNINNTLYFSGGPNSPSTALWKSDGTLAGTVQVKNIAPINFITNVNGTIFFSTPGVGTFNIWKSDGTTDGTVQVKSISTTGFGTYTVGYLNNINGTLSFLAPHQTGGTEIWKCNGTDAGTVLVKDINPGMATSNAENFAVINGTLYFSATNGADGKEIWRSDASEAGTFMVQDINTGGDALPSNFTLVGSKLFVAATGTATGREVWVADLNLALPLTLSDLKGQLSGNDGLLSWKTLFEQNTSHFEIERSTDRRNFIKAGTIAAAGNSSIEKQYGYTDPGITLLNEPVVYYRLKTKDVDGRSAYSKIIAININNKEAVAMLYPNPVRESATLMISVVKKENISYSLIDQNGKMVQQKNITVDKGSNSILVETNSLAAGVYTISLHGPYSNMKLKFVKQ